MACYKYYTPFTAWLIDRAGLPEERPPPVRKAPGPIPWPGHTCTNDFKTW